MFRVNLLYLGISEANHYCQAKLPIKMRFEEKKKYSCVDERFKIYCLVHEVFFPLQLDSSANFQLLQKMSTNTTDLGKN